MKSPLIQLLTLGLFLALLAAPSWAAVPTFLPLQGELTDAAGESLDGPVTMSFSLYPSKTALAPVWTEMQVVDVEKGRFVVYLGTQAPLASELLSDHHDLWLSVTVENDSPMERVALGSVPFAAFAQYCGSAPDHSHGATDLAGVVAAGQKCQVGSVVVGFDGEGQAICEPIAGGGPGGGTYDGEDFAVSGTSCPPGQVMTGISTFGLPLCTDLPDANGGGNGGLSGGGSSKKLAQFTGPATLGDSIITQYNNKIGINESYPSRTVEIKGDLEVTGDFYWGGNNFTSSSCLVVGSTSCSSACSKHKMSCYKAMRIDEVSDSTSCGQSGFKFCCCKN